VCGLQVLECMELVPLQARWSEGGVVVQQLGYEKRGGIILCVVQGDVNDDENNHP
jgi:hypothetical protein